MDFILPSQILLSFSSFDQVDKLDSHDHFHHTRGRCQKFYPTSRCTDHSWIGESDDVHRDVYCQKESIFFFFLPYQVNQMECSTQHHTLCDSILQPRHPNP